MKKIIFLLIPTIIKQSYLFQLCLSKAKEKLLFKSYNDLECDCPKEKTVVFCAIDKSNVGGLSDRLWGFISTYLVCSLCNIKFKACWVYPFDIRKFLVPNEYDWSMEKEELCLNPRYSTPIFVANNHNESNQLNSLKRIAKTKKQQIHMHTNAHMDRSNFGLHFNKLFKPSALLAQNIDSQIFEMGGVVMCR